jgi:hypothetical protein
LSIVAKIIVQRLLTYVVVGILVHILSNAWSPSIYHLFLTIRSPSTSSSLLNDFSIVRIPSYFTSTEGLKWFGKDLFFLVKHILFFSLTGFLVLETMIYQLLCDRFGRRIVRLLGLNNNPNPNPIVGGENNDGQSSLQRWIVESQLSINRLVYLMKNALIQHYQHQLIQLQQQLTSQQEQLQAVGGGDGTRLTEETAGVTSHRRHHHHRRHRRHQQHSSSSTMEIENMTERLNIADNDIGKQMSHLYLHLYYPFFYHIVLKGFLLFIVLPTLLFSNLPFSNKFASFAVTKGIESFLLPSSMEQGLTFLFSFHIHWTIMRFAVASFILMMIFPYSIHPFYKSMTLLYNKIKDENYLIGRKLLNLSEKVRFFCFLTYSLFYFLVVSRFQKLLHLKLSPSFCFSLYHGIGDCDCDFFFSFVLIAISLCLITSS